MIAFRTSGGLGVGPPDSGIVVSAIAGTAGSTPNSVARSPESGPYGAEPEAIHPPPFVRRPYPWIANRLHLTPERSILNGCAGKNTSP
jgi:hypothetical protein